MVFFWNGYALESSPGHNGSSDPQNKFIAESLNTWHNPRIACERLLSDGDIKA